MSLTPGASGKPRSPAPLAGRPSSSAAAATVDTLAVPQQGVGLFPLRSSSSPSSTQQQSSSASLSPNTSTTPTGSATGNPRNKVSLKPGFSLMEWIRLTKSGKDLAGTGGKFIDVTAEELKKHKKRGDAWIALNGKVYNVTPYMDFHPGGWDELIKGAGKDATDMFNDIHSWVNYESMLAACLVGKLVDRGSSPLNKLVKKNSVSAAWDDSMMLPPSKPVIPPIKSPPSRTPLPTLDTHQTDEAMTVCVYTRRPDTRKEDVIAEVDDSGNNLRCVIKFNDDQTAFVLRYKLFAAARLNVSKVKVAHSIGKVEFVLEKMRAGKWANLGEALEDSGVVVKESALHPEWREWYVCGREQVTHDVQRLFLKPPLDNQGFHFFVPTGHHVRIQADVEGMDIVRSYTPVFKSFAAAQDDVDDEGGIHLLYKTYPDGAMTSGHLRHVQVGFTVRISDHMGKFNPLALSDVNHLILIAAGTGFTPMAKLTTTYLSTSKPSSGRRRVSFCFFNKTAADIMWKDQVDKFSSEHEEEFAVHHALSREDDPSAWEGARGRISKEMLEGFVGGDKEPGKSLACICGPIPFIKDAERILKEMDYGEEEIKIFQG